ncbi:MAG: FAD-dependent oxidoreductase [Anaerolineaceae bacterium]|nr:NAD(P)/FAD-dependent oxidoreductase [Anaerolineae bacterium]MBL1172563.1 NAD(P)/FAD-dependent oxidoreductase [Chloroflexota bacterium]MDL1926548.1 NAD(P)/FAD-dependent oxidoreductase [Anaerolineae bacterium AMX1]WKZ54190.1 MAG: NAD(P)/FAD-dependent oxidoreductase [Anaerolineales bacterium]GJQ38015.1 MAG: FAD-dependent oxidoreductase [Anaerolineaceae bacterium]
MTNRYNVIIIGAGHNGLVAAAYLAKRGKKVLVLERRAVVGGTVVTESFGDGFTVDSVQTGGRLRPDIVKDLKLASRGLQPDSGRRPFLALTPDGAPLALDAESIKRVSDKDAARWPEFVRFMDRVAQILDVTYAIVMPRLPMNFGVKEGYGLLEWGLELRLAGRKDMLNFIRALPMTAQELADEYFESEIVKAAIASVAIHGSTLGPMSAGTGYTLIHNWLNRGGLAHVNVGKAGESASALENAVKAFGGEIRTEAEVASIKIENQTAKGVTLASGEEISADVVLSSADPKHTLLELVGAQDLPPEFVWRVQSIKMRGSAAKVHLQTNGQHGIPAGTLCVAPSVKYLEKAYDAAKYGEISEKPYLEVTTSGNTVSIHFQYAPYNLKNGEWKAEREKVEKLAIDTLAEYFPNLKSSTLAPGASAGVVNRKLITPLDLEQTYGLTEGDVNHGQLMLDQFLFMRPMPGWSNHKTPIDNLYLCGSGVHGGGGVSGAAGRNVVKVLK